MVKTETLRGSTIHDMVVTAFPDQVVVDAQPVAPPPVALAGLIAGHAGQSSRNSVLWRPLELLGDTDSGRWLCRPRPLGSGMHAPATSGAGVTSKEA